MLELGREQFCLITSFRFRYVAKEETKTGLINPGLTYSPFCDRLFPENIEHKIMKIKGNQLLALLKPGKSVERFIGC